MLEGVVQLLIMIDRACDGISVYQTYQTHASQCTV